MASNLPSSIIQLTISCKGLKNGGMLKGKPNPCVYIYMENSSNNASGEWVQIGHTETIKEELSPKFQKTFSFDYFFEKSQKLAFVLVNSKKDGEDDIMSHKYMGYCEAPLGQIVSSGKYSAYEALITKVKPPNGINVKTNSKSPKHEGKYGKFSILVEELEDSKNVYNFKVSCRNLDKKDKISGNSDPYLTVSRKQMDGNMLEIYKSEVIKKNLNPSFNRFSINASVLCNCDRDKPLLWTVRDWNKDGEVKFIGEFEATVNEIMNKEPKEFELIYEKKKKTKGYVNSGILVFDECSLDVPKVELPPGFYDFISTGTEIKLTIGIDMSASNGGFSKARIENCLHRIHPDGSLNDYQKAIKVIGSILESYDSDKLIPVYGFGCKVNDKVEHCYPLNENEENPEVDGIGTVLEVYEDALKRVQFSGPTTLSALINNVKCNPSDCIDGDISGVVGTESNNLKSYNILLVLTDGEITSFRDTVDAIVENSNKALSIVIVGIGDCSFTDMIVLDGNNKKLISSKGKEAARDIVTFVQMKKFRDDSPAELAQAVLKEIPIQFQSFINQYRVVPYGKDKAKLHTHLQSEFDLSSSS